MPIVEIAGATTDPKADLMPQNLRQVLLEDVV